MEGMPVAVWELSGTSAPKELPDVASAANRSNAWRARSSIAAFSAGAVASMAEASISSAAMSSGRGGGGRCAAAMKLTNAWKGRRLASAVPPAAAALCASAASKADCCKASGEKSKVRDRVEAGEVSVAHPTR